MPNLQRGRLRAPHSVKRVRRALLYIRPLALPHEPALVRAVEEEVGDLRRLGRHVRQLRRGRNEAATVVWVVLPVVRLVRGASVCRAARRREKPPLRGRSSVGSDGQRRTGVCYEHSARLRLLERSVQRKGPFLHGAHPWDGYLHERRVLRVVILQLKTLRGEAARAISAPAKPAATERAFCTFIRDMA